MLQFTGGKKEMAKHQSQTVGYDKDYLCLFTFEKAEKRSERCGTLIRSVVGERELPFLLVFCEKVSVFFASCLKETGEGK